MTNFFVSVIGLQDRVPEVKNLKPLRNASNGIKSTMVDLKFVP
jgi:hypothetical protein